MSLWSMSISGGIFIAAVIIVRGLLRKRLPGIVFQVLWLAVLLRLMVPFSIPCRFSIYTLVERCGLNTVIGEGSGNGVGESDAAENIVAEDEWNTKAVAYDMAEDEGEGRDKEGMSGKMWDIHATWMCIYLCGVVLSMLYYLLACLNWHRKFKTSSAVQPAVQVYVDALPLRRKISVRQWKVAASPLTYGILHPVILLPQTLEGEDMEQLKMVLVHEYMHIRHFDAARKVMLVLACCVHWFNPLVWMMGILANRDMEIACDENVIKYLGRDMRSAYALALIDMEEQRDILVSWGNSFSKNAMEERVIAIMKEKNKSIMAGVASGILAAGLIMVFTTSAYAIGRAEKTVYVQADDVAADENSENVDGAVQETGQDIAYAEEGAVQEETVTNDSTADASGIAYAEEGAVQGEAVTNDSAADASDIVYTIENGASEGDSVPDVDEEYAAYGITANPHTGAWEYQGKTVAVFYDKGRFLSTYDVPEESVSISLISIRDKKGFLTTKDDSKENVAYLEVCRDKKGRIEKIKEHSKKEMQILLKDTGLVL